MKEKIEELRKTFSQQITQANENIKVLTGKIADEKQKLEQLRGAIYALDVLSSSTADQTSAATEEQK